MNRRPSKDQRAHWTEVYTVTPAFFGDGPSETGRRALDLFRKEGSQTVLELGFGQGRDTFLFAENGLWVTALDYSETAVEAVTAEARQKGLSSHLTARFHDVRQPLPFGDDSFDACYCHMLLCMELTTAEVAFVLREMHRVLKPGGVALYTVRSDHDKHYRAGTPRGEDIYEVGGFVVHFFTAAKIRRLARGYDVLAIDRVEEGSLPRDLYVVTLRQDPDVIPLPIPEEERMTRPMDKFQEFFEATHHSGVLDGKTRGLLFLGASLATGCEL